MTKIAVALSAVNLAYALPGLLTDIVSVSHEAARTVGTTAHLRTGDRLPLRDLLAGLLLPSGNDAGRAIAEHCGARALAAGTIPPAPPHTSKHAKTKTKAVQSASRAEHKEGRRALVRMLQSSGVRSSRRSPRR